MHSGEKSHRISRGDALSALTALGRDPQSREQLIAALRQLEAVYPDKTVDIREMLTGPIVDALFEHDELLQKKLSSGLSIWFRYRSKIARDFMMEPFADQCAR